jgi:VWFA-related protein
VKSVSYLACALALALPALRPAAAQAPSAGVQLRVAQPNSARFPRITLYAYPTDSRGLLMSDLPSGSFAVTENGAPAGNLEVTAKGGTLDVCLAIDRSPSMQLEHKIDYAKAAAQEFVTQLRPSDRAAVITFASGSTLDQGLTTDRDAVRRAIERTQTSGNSTTFYDAVYWAITQVGLQAPGSNSVLGSGPARPDARRVVVALTDGMDEGSRVLPQELLETARQNGVSLCMVALGSDAQNGYMPLLSKETGGLFLRAPRPEDLKDLYVSLARQLQQEYQVTYTSPNAKPDNTRRNVELVLSPGAKATTWYMAPAVGSLLGGFSSTPKDGAPVSAGGSGKISPQLWIGSLLTLLGVAGTAVALVVWRSRREPCERLDIIDSNPRLDLLPLWVREGSTRIGRAPECELVLDSREVSRVHARIEAWEGVFRLVDEGSSNGTYVNDRRVRKRELRVGDVVRFGDREFRFSGEMPG